jgi:putative sterol carrier protein
VKRVVTAQDAFDYMAKAFKKDEALKMKQKVVVQYNVLGPGGGTWQLALENGAYKITPGDSMRDVSCTMSFDSVESFVGLINGELPPLKAYTQGKARFSGSQKLIMEVGKVFPLGKK